MGFRTAALVGAVGLAACHKGDDTAVEGNVPGLQAVSGVGGVLVRASESAQISWVLEGSAGSEWAAITGYEGATLEASVAYWVPDAALGGATELRFSMADASVQGASSAAVASDFSAAFFSSRTVIDGDDSVDITSTSTTAALAGLTGAVSVARTSTGSGVSEAGFLSSACVSGDDAAVCFGATDDGVVATDLAALPTLPGWVVMADQPRVEALTVTLYADATTPEGVALAPVAEVVLPELYAMGRVSRWGDLHGHSNLSADGCENTGTTCSERSLGAGMDFFPNAIDQGLDFAAMTEHAEYLDYYPDGLTGEAIDIWQQQQAIAVAAEVEGFVPLVGYEWTHRWLGAPPATVPPEETPQWLGGHKSVVFRDAEICETYRIGAGGDFNDYAKGTAVYTVDPARRYADSPADLIEKFGAAEATCGWEPLLTFFHHTTNEKPQPVDWSNVANVPDTRFENLVEVYSEHGMFECLDPTSLDCDWWINDGTYRYYAQGSVQAALSQGYNFGFVAGTDCHDGRPGSWEDGPSSTGQASIVIPQFAPGGYTGVLVSGPLDRTSLFEGLTTRHTIATSGPRPDVYALAHGADGTLHLPGSVIPAAAWPIEVTISLENYDGEVISISLVDAGGTLLAEADGPELTATLDASLSLAFYARAVFDLDGDDHRVWISPFFQEN
jgi:hypothetical protein